MTLEDILKTAKAVVATAKQDLWDRPDEWIRKQYQAIGDKIPEGQFYKATFGIQALPFISYYVFISLMNKDNPSGPYISSSPMDSLRFISDASLGGLESLDIFYNSFGLIGLFPEQYRISTPILKSPFEYSMHQIFRLTRFPIFLYGLGVESHSLSTAMHNASFQDSGSNFMLGLLSLGLASSMYLKDREPRQLKKDPFWKRAYNAAREKITEYLPQPVPVPVPAQIRTQSYTSVATASL